MEKGREQKVHYGCEDVSMKLKCLKILSEYCYFSDYSILLKDSSLKKARVILPLFPIQVL